MGLDAEIIGVGPFTREIAGLLDYPSEYYENARDGAIVTTRLFGCLTSADSHALAKCFGFEAFDFNRHHLQDQTVNEDSLRALFGAEEVDRFLLLKSKGFQFHYRPNG